MTRFIFIAIFIILFTSCDYKESELIGRYANNYSGDLNPRMIPHEAPAKVDTLTLFEGGTFTSQYFGVGRYKLVDMGSYNIIHLSYKIGSMNVGHGFSVKKKTIFSRTPILKIDADGEYYYKKLAHSHTCQ